MHIRTSIERAQHELLDRGWVRHIDWQPEVDSTHEQAKRWLRSLKSPNLPALFVADVQRAGRGRSGNQWWSPRGCLMMTLSIDGQAIPTEAERWSQLALICGVAVAETIEGWIPHVERRLQLKWPNDVYLAEKKCAGILIESGPGSTWLIGIGINVNVDFSEAPAAISDKATSIHRYLLEPYGAGTATSRILPSGPGAGSVWVRNGDPASQIPAGHALSTEGLLVDLVERLRIWIQGWSSGELQWQAAWHQRCLLGGKLVRIRGAGGAETAGLCEGVDADGRLLVRREQGVCRVHSGEVICWHS